MRPCKYGHNPTLPAVWRNGPGTCPMSSRREARKMGFHQSDRQESTVTTSKSGLRKCPSGGHEPAGAVPARQTPPRRVRSSNSTRIGSLILCSFFPLRAEKERHSARNATFSPTSRCSGRRGAKGARNRSINTLDHLEMDAACSTPPPPALQPPHPQPRQETRALDSAERECPSGTLQSVEPLSAH